MEDVGDHEDDHGEGVESSLVGAVEFLAGEELLEDDDDGVEGGDLLQPPVDGVGGDQPEVAALLGLVLGLDGDVGVDGPAVVGPVELVVHRADGGVEEGQLGVDGELDERDGCGLDKLGLGDPGLREEQLLQLLQCGLDLLVLGQEVHVHEDGVIHCDVDIAVPNCYSAGAAAE